MLKNLLCKIFLVLTSPNIRSIYHTRKKIPVLFIILFSVSLLGFGQEGTYAVPTASSTGVSLYLEKGEYTVTYISGAHKFANDSRPEPFQSETRIALAASSNDDPLQIFFSSPAVATAELVADAYQGKSESLTIAESGDYRIYFRDSSYGDNSGFLTVEISSECACQTCKINMASGNGESLGTKTGLLEIDRTELESSNNYSSPEHLKYKSYFPLNEEQINDTNNNLKQIKNDSGLTQIDITNSDKYTVKQYSSSKVGSKDGSGYYTVTGNPDTEIIYSKTSSAPSKLNIQEKKGGVVVGNTSLDFSNGYWIKGQDVDGDDTADRYEYETSATSGSNTVKTAFIEDGSHNVVSKIQRTYDANNNLIEEVIDPDGAALTTSYQYDVNNNNTRIDYPDGSYETITYTANNLPELTTRTSGLFTKNQYDTSDRIIKIIESFNGSTYTATESDHKVTSYSYTPVYSGDDGSVKPDAVRTVSVSLLGNPVSKTYYGYLAGVEHTIYAATPTSAITDSNNLISSAFYDVDDQIIQTIEPDGTGSIITYDVNGTTTATTTESGVFNAGLTAIVQGTETVEIVTDDLEVSRHTFDVVSGLLISSRIVTERDSADREKLVDYHDGTYEMFIYGCCNLDSTRSREGIWTDYTYDSLGRQVTSTTNGITEITTYDAAGNIKKREQQGTDATLRTLVENSYDSAGRLQWTKDALNNQTIYSETYNTGQTTSTTTYPDTTTEITVTDSEGQLVSLSGTAVFARGADLDQERVELDSTLGYYVHIQRNGETNNWVDSYTDALGRVYKTITIKGATAKQFYAAGSGRLTKSVSESGAVTLYYEEPANNISIEALDVNQNDTIDYGTDTITRVKTDVLTENSIIWNRTQTWANPDTLANPGAADNINKVSNHGLARVNTSITNGISSTFEIQTEINDNGLLTTTATRPDGSYTVTKFTNGLQEYEKSYDVNDTLLHEIGFGYDKFNRLQMQTDSRNGTTTYSYDLNDRVLSLTTSDPDGSGPKTAQTFTNVYNNMGRRDKVVNPDNTEIHFDYTTQGLIKKSYGDNVYPREYVYDSKGQLENVKTWKNYSGQTGLNELVWTYNDQGQLATETDKFNRVTSYTYYDNGLLHTRTNPRNIVKTYTYDTSGRLSTISYSDSTPSISFSYNELGQLNTVTDAGGTRSYNYNTLGQFTGTSWTSGYFNGIDQTYSYDSIGRQQSFVRDIGTQQKTVSYDYDDYGRLSKVTKGAHSFEYSYLNNSPNTVEKLSVKKNSSIQMYSLRQFDKLMRTKQFSWFNTGQ